MEKHQGSPRKALKEARESCGLSQSELAKLVEVSSRTIRLWEQGKSTPFRYHYKKLMKSLRVTLEELEALLANTQQENLEEKTSQRLWVRPQRNPYFVGRDDLLQMLHSAFLSGKGLQRQTLTGQPGIGKTQSAIEYTHRYAEDYQVILWIKAETIGVLVADVMHIASLLQLPEKENSSERYIIEQVRLWLEANSGWLLVLDNVDDSNILDNVLPQEGQGHMLLTTRDPEAGTLTTTTLVKPLAKDHGVTLLLRRAKLIWEQGKLSEASEMLQSKAREIEEEMDGHSLALDQAGAYIAETGCTPERYLELYRQRRDKFLHERGRIDFGHPDSLAATILLSFERIRQANMTAANILYMSTFLYADNIPEELFQTGNFMLAEAYYPVAKDGIALMEAVRTLRRYSLIQYDTVEKTVSLHRLIQDVMKSQISNERQYEWVCHVIRVLNHVLLRIQPRRWQPFQRYLSHALLCVKQIDDWHINHGEIPISLLLLVGACLRDMARFTQAEHAYQRAIQIAQETLEPEHHIVIAVLYDMGLLYEYWGKYEQAEPYYQQALTLLEKKPSTDKHHIITLLMQMASLHKSLGKYPSARVLAEQALSMQEALSEPESTDLAPILNMLAEIYRSQRKYTAAEPLFIRALALYEKTGDVDPLPLSLTLYNLISLYIDQRKYMQAESLTQRMLEIVETQQGPDHPETAKSLLMAADVYRHINRISQAENYCKRGFALFEKVYSPNAVQMISPLSLLAAICHEQNHYEEAERLFKQALTVAETKLGPDHPDKANILTGYALLLWDLERYDEAEKLDERSLQITRLWLEKLSPVEMFKLEYAAMKRKYLRKGKEVTFNGVKMTGEEFFTQWVQVVEKILTENVPGLSEKLNSDHNS